MKRIFLWVGAWASVVVIAGVCLAAGPQKPGNQPAVPASPQAAPSGGAGGGLRYAAPPSSSAAAARAAQAQAAAAAQRAAQARAAAAAQRAAAARSAAASSAQPNPPYGYGNYYSRYGYNPYGYYPYGTSPYVLGYNPWTGQAYLYPYTGGGYSPYYQQYGYQPYYANSYLGYGYPGAVFAPADLLFGPAPIQQLMGMDQ